VKEIWLTSEDLGAWGRDIGLALPDLLDALIGTGDGNDGLIPSDCMLRLGMTNPPYILDHLQDIARALNHPRVYSFLHIPVQSASDSVLVEMKREYTIDEFCKVVDYMQTHVPGVYIATDFICAFPTESESDFELSLSLVEKYRFPSLFINQFYPRKGTPAARLKKIDSIEAKRRTGEMSRLFHSYTRYGHERIGQVVHVLVCERASDGQHLVGHTKSYEQVLINAPSSLLGQWSWVRVSAVSKFHMKAELIPQMSMAKLLSTSTWTPSFFLLIMSILVFFILRFFFF